MLNYESGYFLHTAFLKFPVMRHRLKRAEMEQGPKQMDLFKDQIPTGLV